MERKTEEPWFLNQSFHKQHWDSLIKRVQRIKTGFAQVFFLRFIHVLQLSYILNPQNPHLSNVPHAKPKFDKKKFTILKLKGTFFGNTLYTICNQMILKNFLFQNHPT